MILKYEKITGKKLTRSPLKLTLEEINKTIVDLTEKIEQYGNGRKIEVKYHERINNGGEEVIEEVEIKSGDDVINGKIIYHSGEIPISDQDPKIEAKFNFNSTDKADKEEYLGLVKIIKEM